MNHEAHMVRCMALALRGSGYVAPNPMVGAVLVYGDRVIGEGWHHEYGRDHAEVDCLNNVRPEDRQLIPESTMYVNLEPCAHYGNTPPCANRLVAEGIKEVVIANTDPFEKVSGKGITILEQAGIRVTTGVQGQQGIWLNRRFFTYHTRRRPYIVLKWAQTADGFIAPEDRSRYQISSKTSQQMVHKWRTEEAAIMVGATTAGNDNPQLTARLAAGKQPLRIVLDRHLQLPDSHHVFDKSTQTWIVNEQREQTIDNIHYIQLVHDGTLLSRLMERLYDARILSLIVEGGAMLLDGFIDQGLWDEARVFTGASKLVKGVAAPVLTDNLHAFSTESGTDTLDLYVNRNSAYPYAAGADL